MHDFITVFRSIFFLYGILVFPCAHGAEPVHQSGDTSIGRPQIDQQTKEGVGEALFLRRYEALVGDGSNISEETIEKVAAALESYVGVPVTEMLSLGWANYREESPPESSRRLLSLKQSPKMMEDNYLLLFELISVGWRDKSELASRGISRENPTYREALIQRVNRFIYKTLAFANHDPDFKGEFLGEPNNGEVLMTAKNMDQKSLLAALTSNPQTRITVLHDVGLNERERADAVKHLSKEQASRVHFVEVAHAADRWVQDFRGIPVRKSDGQHVLLDPAYHPTAMRETEDRFPETQAKMAGVPTESFPLALEGGNLKRVSGPKGSFTVVSDSVVRHNRRVLGLSEEEIKKMSERYLGPIVWIPAQDDGTGHVDMQLFVGRDKSSNTDVVFVGEITDEGVRYVDSGTEEVIKGARFLAHIRKEFGGEFEYYYRQGKERSNSVSGLSKAIDSLGFATKEVAKDLLDMTKRTVQQIPSEHARHKKAVQEAKRVYDETAQKVAETGVRVVRVPVPPPSFEGGKAVFYGSLNAITVGDTIYLPKHRHLINDSKAIKEVVAPYFSSAEFVPNALNELCGGIHCTAPQLQFPLKAPR